MLDVRLAIRALKRSPGFLIITTSSLALALGLCTTTYAVLDAVVNPTIPVSEPERLFVVGHTGDGASRDVTAYDRVLRIRDAAAFHDGMATVSSRYGSITIGNRVSFGSVYSVSSNYLDVLGVKLDRGRGFRPLNYTADDNAVIIGHRMWRRDFAGQDLTNASLTFNDQVYTVIGVLPPNLPGDIYTRTPATGFGPDNTPNSIVPVARLKTQSTVASANEELDAIANAMTADLGTGRRAFEFGLRSLVPDPLQLNGLHYALGGAAIVVLLIACTNLANLMLARGYARRRDLALHTALGATRRQLIKQVVAEAAIIVTIGGALGTFFTVWGINTVTNRMPQELELIGRMMPTFNARVFGFALVATVATVLVFGVLPAVRISNVDVNEPLKSATGSTTPRMHARYNKLAIAEIGLSMILLMGAGLLLKAAETIDAYDFGYDTSGLYKSAVWLRDTDPQQFDAVFQDVVDAVGSIDGVRDVATMTNIAPERLMVTADIASGMGDAQLNVRTYQRVSHNFFKTMGLSVQQGRDFLPGDESDRGAAVLDQDAARQLFRGEDPIGQLIKLGPREADLAWIPVVGVVQNASLKFERDPDLPPHPKVYVMEPGSRFRDVVVRTNNSDPTVPLLIKERIETAVPGPNLSFVNSWRGQFESEVRTRSFLAGLFGVFGLFALALAAVGLYGVLTYAVSQRMREFGVRLALGAQTRDVLRLVLHDGAVMILAGTGLGAFIAMWAGTLLQQWLYSVPPTDVVSLLGAEVVLVIVSLIACLVPALHATTADPLETLRAT